MRKKLVAIIVLFLGAIMSLVGCDCSNNQDNMKIRSSAVGNYETVAGKDDQYLLYCNTNAELEYILQSNAGKTKMYNKLVLDVEIEGVSNNDNKDIVYKTSSNCVSLSSVVDGGVTRLTISAVDSGYAKITMSSKVYGLVEKSVEVYVEKATAIMNTKDDMAVADGGVLDLNDLATQDKFIEYTANTTKTDVEVAIAYNTLASDVAKQALRDVVEQYITIANGKITVADGTANALRNTVLANTKLPITIRNITSNIYMKDTDENTVHWVEIVELTKVANVYMNKLDENSKIKLESFVNDGSVGADYYEVRLVNTSDLTGTSSYNTYLTSRNLYFAGLDSGNTIWFNSDTYSFDVVGSSSPISNSLYISPNIDDTKKLSMSVTASKLQNINTIKFAIDYKEYPGLFTQYIYIKFIRMQVPTENDIYLNGELDLNRFVVYNKDTYNTGRVTGSVLEVSTTSQFVGMSYRYSLSMDNNGGLYNNVDYENNPDYIQTGSNALINVRRLTGVDYTSDEDINQKNKLYVSHNFDNLASFGGKIILTIQLTYDLSGNSSNGAEYDKFYVTKSIELSLVQGLTKENIEGSFLKDEFVLDVTDYQDKQVYKLWTPGADLKVSDYINWTTDTGAVYNRKYFTLDVITEQVNGVDQQYLILVPNQEYLTTSGKERLTLNFINGTSVNKFVECVIPFMFGDSDGGVAIAYNEQDSAFMYNGSLLSEAVFKGNSAYWQLFDMQDADTAWTRYQEYIQHDHDGDTISGYTYTTLHNLVIAKGSSLAISVQNYMYKMTGQSLGIEFYNIPVDNNLRINIRKKYSLQGYSGGKLNASNTISNRNNPDVVEITYSGYAYVTDNGVKSLKPITFTQHILVWVYDSIQSIELNRDNTTLYDYRTVGAFRQSNSMYELSYSVNPAITNLGGVATDSDKGDGVSIRWGFFKKNIENLTDAEKDELKDLSSKKSDEFKELMDKYIIADTQYTVDTGNSKAHFSLNEVLYLQQVNGELRLIFNMSNVIDRLNKSNISDQDIYDAIFGKDNTSKKLDLAIVAEQFSSRRALDYVTLTLTAANMVDKVVLSNIVNDGVSSAVEDDGLYAEQRNITNSNNIYDINYVITGKDANRAIYNTNVRLQYGNSTAVNGRNIFEIVDENGNVLVDANGVATNYFKNNSYHAYIRLTGVPGTQILYISSEDSFTIVNGNIVRDNSKTISYTISVSDGSAEYPYRIYNVNDYARMLQDIRNDNYYHYTIVRDINLSNDTRFSPSALSDINVVNGSGKTFALNGKYSYTSMSGEVINNARHKIMLDWSNATISTSDTVNSFGLFASISGVKITNVTLSINANILAKIDNDAYIGGFAGKISRSSELINCQVEGTILYTELTTSINGKTVYLGSMAGEVADSKVYVDEAKQFGQNFDVYTNIKLYRQNSDTTGVSNTIVNKMMVGGAFGAITNSDQTKGNYSKLSVFAQITEATYLLGILSPNKGSYVGGVVGSAGNAKLTNIESYPYIRATRNVGGMVGTMSGSTISLSKVYFISNYSNEKSVTAIDASDMVGGMVANADGNNTIKYSYVRGFNRNNPDGKNYLGDMYIPSNTISFGGLVANIGSGKLIIDRVYFDATIGFKELITKIAKNILVGNANDNNCGFVASKHVTGAYAIVRTNKIQDIDETKLLTSFGNKGYLYINGKEIKRSIDSTTIDGSTTNADNTNAWFYNSNYADVNNKLPMLLYCNTVLYDIIPSGIDIEIQTDTVRNNNLGWLIVNNGTDDPNRNSQVIIFHSSNSEGKTNRYVNKYVIGVTKEGKPNFNTADGYKYNNFIALELLGSVIETNYIKLMAKDGFTLSVKGNDTGIVSIDGNIITTNGYGRVTLVVSYLLDSSIYAEIELIVYSNIYKMNMTYTTDSLNKATDLKDTTNKVFVNEEMYLTANVVNMYDGGFIAQNIYFDVETDMGVRLEILKDSGKFTYAGTTYSYDENNKKNNYIYIDSILTNRIFTITPVENKDILFNITPYYTVDTTKVMVDSRSADYTIKVSARATSIVINGNKTSAELSAIGTQNLELAITTANVVEENGKYRLKNHSFNMSVYSKVSNELIGTVNNVCELLDEVKNATFTLEEITEFDNIVFSNNYFKDTLMNVKLTGIKISATGNNDYVVTYYLSLVFNKTEYQRNYSTINMINADYHIVFTPSSNSTIDTVFDCKIKLNNPVDIDFNFYTNAETKDGEFNPQEVESKYIAPGRNGLIKLQIFEDFNSADRIDMYFDTNYLQYISYNQMTALTSVIATNNMAYITGYKDIEPYLIYENGRAIGIRLDNITSTYGNTEFFNNIFYIKLKMQNETPASLIASDKYLDITIKAYDYNGQQVMTDRSERLIIETLPVADISIDGTDLTVLEVGDYKEIVWDAYNYNTLLENEVDGKYGVKVNVRYAYDELKDYMFVVDEAGLEAYINLKRDDISDTDRAKYQDILTKYVSAEEYTFYISNTNIKDKYYLVSKADIMDSDIDDPYRYMYDRIDANNNNMTIEKYCYASVIITLSVEKTINNTIEVATDEVGVQLVPVELKDLSLTGHTEVGNEHTFQVLNGTYTGLGFDINEESIRSIEGEYSYEAYNNKNAGNGTELRNYDYFYYNGKYYNIADYADKVYSIYKVNSDDLIWTRESADGKTIPDNYYYLYSSVDKGEIYQAVYVKINFADDATTNRYDRIDSGYYGINGMTINNSQPRFSYTDDNQNAVIAGYGEDNVYVYYFVYNDAKRGQSIALVKRLEGNQGFSYYNEKDITVTTGNTSEVITAGWYKVGSSEFLKLFPTITQSSVRSSTLNRFVDVLTEYGYNYELSTDNNKIEYVDRIDPNNVIYHTIIDVSDPTAVTSYLYGYTNVKFIKNQFGKYINYNSRYINVDESRSKIYCKDEVQGDINTPATYGTIANYYADMGNNNYALIASTYTTTSGATTTDYYRYRIADFTILEKERFTISGISVFTVDKDGNKDYVVDSRANFYYLDSANSTTRYIPINVGDTTVSYLNKFQLCRTEKTIVRNGVTYYLEYYTIKAISVSDDTVIMAQVDYFYDKDGIIRAFVDRLGNSSGGDGIHDTREGYELDAEGNKVQYRKEGNLIY